jgi:hypothetical protein
VCRWELLPNQPDVLLSVDYRGLLPDESITLELSPNNIIRLETPDGGPGAVFQASAWVDSSILVSFQSTRTSTDRGERRGGRDGEGGREGGSLSVAGQRMVVGNSWCWSSP